ncbi:MAG: energy-coupling factor transporter transmembrane protein EcfT [Phascolarctobacterium sp.]|nr:energy-coupling factor transporter transmembrane protein EcfT [Phascolarctobacterium sp.]
MMLKDITLWQYFPGDSFIYKLDPRTKILATFIYIVAIFFAYDPASYAVLIAFAAFVIGASRLPIWLVVKSLKPVWLIAIITLLVHMLTFPGENVIYTWSVFKVTAEGLETGLKMCLRLILLLLFSSVLTFTTSPIVLTDGIESLLWPFKRIGVPAHEIAMMMTIALRFIPTLLEEMERIIKAQTARGADFSEGNFLKRLKGMLPILVPLFVSAFRRADELAIAMEARCYRGGEGRTAMHSLIYKARDYASLAIVIILAAVEAFMRWGA